MVPKHTFVTSMSDAPSVILRRLVLGMSVIVALSLSFSLFFSLSFRFSFSFSRSLFLSEGRRGAQNRRRRFVGWINYVDFIQRCLFPFFFPFFFQMLTSDVRPSLAENEKKNKKQRRRRRRKKRCTKKKKCKKKTFDRFVLESKPRDTFESLEMHLFFFFREREKEEKNVSKPHSTQKLQYQIIILS